MLNFFRSDAYSIWEIREMLDDNESKPVSIISLITDHHDYLEESIPVLTDKLAPFDEKQRHLTRFLHLLNMHARAEEETLYRALANSDFKDAHLESFAGSEEHELAFQIADELAELGYETIWSEVADAKSKVLATLVKNHIDEEESSMFVIAKRDLSHELLLQLGSEYRERYKRYLDAEISGQNRPLDAHLIQKGL
jgi:hemerythrin-like domain-containing protein